jgi:histone H3/H4
MAAKKAKKGGAKAPAANLVVGSKVKEMVRAHGVRMAGDLLDALNAKVAGVMKDAVGRAKANGRGTVRPQDL